MEVVLLYIGGFFFSEPSQCGSKRRRCAEKQKKPAFYRFQYLILLIACSPIPLLSPHLKPFHPIMFHTIHGKSFRTVAQTDLPMQVYVPVAKATKFCGRRYRTLSGCFKCRKKKYVTLRAVAPVLTPEKSVMKFTLCARGVCGRIPTVCGLNGASLRNQVGKTPEGG